LRHDGVSAPDRDNQESSPVSNELDYGSSTIVESRNELRFTLTKGAQTGNLLHDILEHTDFTAPDWQKSCHWPLLKYGVIDVGEGNLSAQSER